METEPDDWICAGYVENVLVENLQKFAEIIIRPINFFQGIIGKH